MKILISLCLFLFSHTVLDTERGGQRVLSDGAFVVVDLI